MQGRDMKMVAAPRSTECFGATTELLAIVKTARPKIM